MMRKIIVKMQIVILATLIFVGTGFYFLEIMAYAKNNSITVPGMIYEFEKDDHYEYSSENATNPINGSSQFGNFSIAGDVKTITTVNGFDAYEVNDGNVEFSYEVGKSLINVTESERHLVDDKSKKVDGLKLDENILKGAVILQTSFDGESWVTDLIHTNIAGDSTDFVSQFYTSKNIQQINGCYYRIIVAYKTSIKLEDRQIAFVKLDNYDYKKYAEVYQFYLVNSKENSTDAASPTAEPMKKLGNKINTGKDNGYSSENIITNKDPHYGWDIGTFFVNGYTRETKDDNGNPLFLKNFGDTVTLWFKLEQDINSLNGNSKLTIAEDTNGFDQYFEIPKTNFKHGALIIRYTDKSGNQVINKYFDYLAANTYTGADTKVELFEEGDYEVALDYEIKNSNGIDSYTDYRIFFSFSIRNGNTMFYIFDNSTGNELSDGAITSNGFRIDLAKSQYLTIDVKRTVLVDGVGGRREDTRINGTANDGDVYTDEGIYTLDIKNLYTGESTSKTVFVGNDSFLKALSVTGLSIKEIEDKMSQGYEIADNGTLIEPKDDIIEEIAEEEIESEKDISETVEEEATLNETGDEPEQEEPININDNAIEKEELGKATVSAISVPIIIVISLVAVTLGIAIAKKKQPGSKLEGNE